jgi:copper homeostasis protein
MLLEVIVQSLADARAAEAGGADRLEVVREIERDGLTPAVDLVRAIASESRLPLRAMVRQNDGFSLTGLGELAELRRAMTAFAELGIDGAVVGFARDGSLDLDALDALLSAAPALQVTLHRAFDRLHDPMAAIAAARTRPQIDRILTAGGPGDWTARCARLREYATAAGPGLIMLAGGGIDESALRLLAGARCVTEAHVGRAARVIASRAAPVSADRVRRLKDIAG